MATLNKLIFNIKNTRNGGEFSDDYKFGNRQLEFILDHFRAEIAAQRSNNNKSLSGFSQELDDLKLRQTNEFKTSNSDFRVFKSYKPVPDLATSHKGKLLDYVGTRDSMLGFQKTTLSTYNLDLENIYATNLYFIIGGYIYIITKNSLILKEVYVRGVFSTPRAVLDFTTEDPTRGFDWNYPMPDNLIGQLNNLTIKNEFVWNKLQAPDIINDGKDG